MVNKRWVVAHASGGRYDPSCFRQEERGVPQPADGQLLVDTHLLSLDPTHLNWVKLDPALQFLPIGEGDAMLGTNIGVVRESRHPDFEAGQVVMGTWAWEQTAVADPMFVQPALPEQEIPLVEQLTILSHVGQAAAGGMLIVGEVKAGDAVLVSAAAGATGSIAAQIAKAKGCRTVGIAGGAAKCRYLREDLGLDGAIDHRADDVGEAIARHFPNGIDLFFDNVGGATLDAALSNMAPNCRIVVCGAISQYDQAGTQYDQAGAQYDQAGESRFTGIRNLPMLIFRQARMQGFVAGQFGERNAEVRDALLALYRDGKLRVPTQLTVFDEIPDALALLLSGGNRGKLIARAA